MSEEKVHFMDRIMISMFRIIIGVIGGLFLFSIITNLPHVFDDNLLKGKR